MSSLDYIETIEPKHMYPLGYNYSIPLDKWSIADMASDFIFVGAKKVTFEIPGMLHIIQDAQAWDEDKDRHLPLFSGFSEFNSASKKHDKLNLVKCSTQDLIDLKGDIPKAILVLETSNEHGMADQRRAFYELLKHNCTNPVIISRSYASLSNEKFQLRSATDMGGLLIDGFGDGVWLSGTECGGAKHVLQTAFGILQATRTRISKTEYISCPSCGRTLFDLQETTAKIRRATSHLKGVKIGIMGCIVNGPGEMADADYGYVGTGPGKISLYKEKEVVQRNVPEAEAVDALIKLIQSHGDWVEAKEETTA
jgi:(E)-4-hydroxy-3-methylbut-2-enyl-diphosphate synthase